MKEQKRIAKEREEAEKQEREQRDAARGYNERIGRNLMDRRSAQARKKYGLARTKAVAIALLLHSRSLPGAGLRLVMPQLKGAQTSTDSDQPAEASYATTAQALEYLVGKVEDAKSQSEVIELISDAQLAAILADHDALDAGEDSYHHDPARRRSKHCSPPRSKGSHRGAPRSKERRRTPDPAKPGPSGPGFSFAQC